LRGADHDIRKAGWVFCVRALLLAAARQGSSFVSAVLTRQRRSAMATYVTLIKFTDKGVREFKDTCKRAADFKTSAKKLGVEVKDTYWCLGAYDGVLIFDAADDNVATMGMLSLSSLGYVTTQTLRSFSSADMSKILAKSS
jgi:uncharacterized protein with GYD domain